MKSNYLMWVVLGVVGVVCIMNGFAKIDCDLTTLSSVLMSFGGVACAVSLAMIMITYLNGED